MNRYTVETLVGVFVFICLLSVGYLTVKLGKMELVGDKYYAVEARFTDVGGLRAGSSVQIAGVEIGRVEKIGLDMETDEAVVNLKLDKDIRLSDDTIAVIKTSGLIGDQFVSLLPGGSDEYIESGGIILETESAIDIQGLLGKYAFGSAE